MAIDPSLIEDVSYVEICDNAATKRRSSSPFSLHEHAGVDPHARQHLSIQRCAETSTPMHWRAVPCSAASVRLSPPQAHTETLASLEDDFTDILTVFCRTVLSVEDLVNCDHYENV